MQRDSRFNHTNSFFPCLQIVIILHCYQLPTTCRTVEHIKGKEKAESDSLEGCSLHKAVFHWRKHPVIFSAYSKSPHNRTQKRKKEKLKAWMRKGTSRGKSTVEQKMRTELKEVYQARVHHEAPHLQGCWEAVGVGRAPSTDSEVSLLPHRR